MDNLTQWLLINIISPIMLPLCMIAALCMIFGAKPEPIMKAFVDMIAGVTITLVSALVIVCRVYITGVVKLVRVAYEIWRTYKTKEIPRPLPPDESPKPRRRTPRQGDFKYKILFALRRFITKS